jgi:hypothetical protein
MPNDVKQLNVNVDCSFSALMSIGVPSDLSDKDLDDFIYEEVCKVLPKKAEVLLGTIKGIQVRNLRVDATEY